MAMGMRKTALRPKIKSLKVRVRRIKEEMGKIREDQECIREEKRSIRKRFGEVIRQCDELRAETQVIMKETACNRIKLILMFSILRAREDGDSEKAAIFTRFLKSISE